jgi:hypothetical protein
MTQKTKSRFPNMPPEIARLPVEKRGFPIPYFVEMRNGEPDFTAVHPQKILDANKKGLCWICGQPVKGLMCFTIGPMCTVNRISLEPPSHLTCARFAVRSCPFLSQPLAKRAPNMGGPETVPGIMLEHNPGVTALWTTRTYRTQKQKHPPGTILFNIGSPINVEWYAKGRPASAMEVMSGFNVGLATLREIAKDEGPESEAELQRLLEKALALLPK